MGASPTLGTGSDRSPADLNHSGGSITGVGLFSASVAWCTNIPCRQVFVAHSCTAGVAYGDVPEAHLLAQQTLAALRI